ncbi:unnamed protein product [Haemonchus placei]|uniref:Secreted protein n=1 Tax=Haemonchus placei TaxID=6290 RepID=A0A0N4WV94_HAEPC|nr:unnamed protein product [Haemonchus placei]
MRRTRDVVVVVVVVAAVVFGTILADDDVHHDEFLPRTTTTSANGDGDVVSVYRLLPRNHTQFDVIRRLFDNSTDLQVRASFVSFIF